MIKKVLVAVTIFGLTGILFLLFLPKFSDFSKKNLYVQIDSSFELPLEIPVYEQQYFTLTPDVNKDNSKASPKAIENSISLDSLVNLYKSSLLHQDLLDSNIFILQKEEEKWISKPVLFSFTLVD